MIIIFHTLYFAIKHFWKLYQSARTIRKFKAKKLCYNVVQISCEQTEDLDLRFDPPLYLQRYFTVQEILLNQSWRTRIKKVLDFGCAELNFFKYLKHLYDINEIICVDIDEETLDRTNYKVSPVTADYLDKRPSPLRVQVLVGDCTQPDARLSKADAVVAIELIEHLYPDSLEALPYNVFHFIKPLIAIFTTPNVEFNVLFPNPRKFRHDDHKFEWTRDQFQSWALNITTRFPNYTVQFDGIGSGPPGSESLGGCSQIAVFFKHSNEEEQLSEVPKVCREIFRESKSTGEEEYMASHGICTYYAHGKQVQEFESGTNKKSGMIYKEMVSVEYPYFIDSRTQEERILDHVRYTIYSTHTGIYYNDEKDRLEYPLYELVCGRDGFRITVSELRNLLAKENFQLEECVTFYDKKRTLCVVHYPNMENQNSPPSSDGSNSDDKGNWNIAPEESDWETDYNKSIKISDEVIESEHEQKTEKIEENEVNEDATDSGNGMKEQKVTLQFHSTLANTSQAVESKDEAKRDRVTSKRLTGSHSKLASTSAPHTTADKIPKKGTNIKNKDAHVSSQGTSKENDARKRKPDSNVNSNVDVNDKRFYKKNIELKVHDSTHSQGLHVTNVKTNRSAKNSISSTSKSSSKGKVMTTSSLKRFPTKIEDSSMPSTSDIKRKKKCKKNDEDKEDIKALTECIIYNTLNNIPEADECAVIPSATEIPKIKTLNCVTPEIIASYVDHSVNEAIGREIVEEVLRNAEALDVSNSSSSDNNSKKSKETIPEPTNQELNHASREALFDPNSEIDMLEEFEIPTPPPPPPPALQVPTIEHHNNIIVIGLSANNEEDAVVLADNADPFPNWLLQLLGANVDEGESHDEPHFYCQGDGIGVHPSIIEVEIDEEESSSDSSSSHREAEPGYTSSDSGVIQLPTDDPDDPSTVEETPRDTPLNRATPGNTSAAESADEFFDTLEDTLTINTRPNSQTRKN